jgi:hypothetical protein
LFLQKQSLAFAVHLFGICTLLTGPGLKKHMCGAHEHRFVSPVYIRALDRMRLVPITTLLTIVLYVHGVVGETPGAPAGDFAHGEYNMAVYCIGDTAVAVEYDLCMKNAPVVNDFCENFSKQSLCFPKCFCDHVLGYNFMIPTIKTVCPKLPPCGAPAQGTPESPTTSPGSPAPSLRASAFTACIAGAVSLAGVNLISV